MFEEKKEEMADVTPDLQMVAGCKIETVDWDVQIEQLPPRRSEQVVVRFIQGSYRPPRINDNPEN